MFTIDETDKQKYTLNSRNTFRVTTGSLQEGGGCQWQGTNGCDTEHPAGVRGGSPPPTAPQILLSISHEDKFQISLLTNIWDLTGVQNAILKAVGGMPW